MGEFPPTEASAALFGPKLGAAAFVIYTLRFVLTIRDIAGLGSMVRAARARAGLTQAALAAACRLSRQTIAQLEAGTFSDLGIRKVERVLANLGLRLRVEPAAPALARAGSSTRLGQVLRARGEARRQIALRLSRGALRTLRKAGVSACIVGSLARNRFRVDSDVDFLIEDRGGMTESRITDLIEASMDGFPFDVVYAERADPVLLEIIRAEAKRGASAVRAA